MSRFRMFLILSKICVLLIGLSNGNTSASTSDDGVNGTTFANTYSNNVSSLAVADASRDSGSVGTVAAAGKDNSLYMGRYNLAQFIGVLAGIIAGGLLMLHCVWCVSLYTFIACKEMPMAKRMNERVAKMPKSPFVILTPHTTKMYKQVKIAKPKRSASGLAEMEESETDSELSEN